MGSAPLVTIGIPVYNGEAYLRAGLKSVFAQTYPNLQVIVTDNASTDGTPAICAEYAAKYGRLQYFRNERNVGYRGPKGNFCRVLSHASSEYFMWASADDVRNPAVVDECVRALERNPRAVLAHGPIELTFRTRPGVIEVVENRMDLSSASAARRIRTFTREIQHNAMLYGLFRREALVKTVYGHHFGHDYLICLQACMLGPIEYISTPVIRYHQRGDLYDAVMYPEQPLTLKDLLFYNGVRRSKCWVTLIKGSWYLVTLQGPSPAEKVAGTAAFVSAFIRRYARRLATEVVFTVFKPLAMLASPFRPMAVKVRAALKRRGFVTT